MTSITIHGLNDPLDRLSGKKRVRMKPVLTKPSKILLSEALGLNSSMPKNYKEDFLDLCGIWGDEKAKEFSVNTSDLSGVSRILKDNQICEEKYCPYFENPYRCMESCNDNNDYGILDFYYIDNFYEMRKWLYNNGTLITRMNIYHDFFFLQ